MKEELKALWIDVRNYFKCLRNGGHTWMRLYSTRSGGTRWACDKCPREKTSG